MISSKRAVTLNESFELPPEANGVIDAYEKHIPFYSGNPIVFFISVAQYLLNSNIPEEQVLHIISNRYNKDVSAVNDIIQWAKNDQWPYIEGRNDQEDEDSLTSAMAFEEEDSEPTTGFVPPEEKEEDSGLLSVLDETIEIDPHCHIDDSPLLPDDIYPRLPKILKEGAGKFNDQLEKDIFLTAALTVLSGLMYNVEGDYGNHTYNPNIFSFIIGPYASGKGTMKFAQQLGEKVHQQLLHAKPTSEEKTVFPEMLFIPGNSSSSAILHHLHSNKHKGIVFETEADTVANVFKQDWGGYSDLLRKAFEHETISQSRISDKSSIRITRPKLSVGLSGTLEQVPGIFRTTENGLFSRFLFYAFNKEPNWKCMTPKKGALPRDAFEKLSDDVLDMFNTINEEDIKFTFTEEQWKLFNEKYELLIKGLNDLSGEGVSRATFRLALIQFRISMILTVLRAYGEDKLSDEIVCSNLDYEIADKLADIYLKHMHIVLNLLPERELTAGEKNAEFLLSYLPDGVEFTRKEAGEIGTKLGLSERSVTTYLRKLLEQKSIIQPRSHGPYKKNM